MPKSLSTTRATFKAQLRPLNEIRPYPNNPRIHPPEQIKLLANLIKKYGIDQPIVVDEAGVILKGHGRRLAAIEAGLEEFPVVVHTGLSEDDKRAIRVGDNQAALLSEWDPQLLRLEVGELQEADYDLELLGFPEAELKAYLGPETALPKDPDEVPKLVKNPVVRRMDIWNLGDHRLYCGDASLAYPWDKLFSPAQRAAMVFTDPPYGVSYEAKSGKFGVIEGDHKRRDDLYKLLLGALRMMAKRTSDQAAFYIWHASATREDFTEAMKAAGLIERQYLIWAKPGIALGHSDYRWQHEPCFYASKGERKPNFYGNRGDSTVWHVAIGGGQRDIAATVGNGILVLDGQGGTLFIQSRVPKNKKLRQVRITGERSVYLAGSDRQDGTVWEVARDSKHVHPTQKPVELARRAIENSSQPGEIVLDAFLGAGTTLIGAELTGRKCYGVELDPIYAEATIERWEKLTGRQAIEAATGKTLEELRATRHSGKSVSGKERSRAKAKRGVRPQGDARLAQAGGVASGEPPIVGVERSAE